MPSSVYIDVERRKDGEEVIERGKQSYLEMLYNRRKTQILRLIVGSAYVTSLEVSATLGITRFNSSMLLKKYHDFGLLRREKAEKGRGYYYNISRSGEKRLHWLEGHDEEEEE